MTEDNGGLRAPTDAEREKFKADRERIKSLLGFDAFAPSPDETPTLGPDGVAVIEVEAKADLSHLSTTVWGPTEPPTRPDPDNALFYRARAAEAFEKLKDELRAGRNEDRAAMGLAPLRKPVAVQARVEPVEAPHAETEEQKAAKAELDAAMHEYAEERTPEKLSKVRELGKAWTRTMPLPGRGR